MKKLFYILFLVFFLAACTEKTTSTLQNKNGLRYELNSEEPFTGIYLIYHNEQGDNKNKYEETHFKAGKRYGLRTKWYDNGQKKSEANYKDGQLDGIKTTWYRTGKKKSMRNFSEGLQIPLKL